MVSQVFPCILFLRPSSGLPWEVQSLINYKIVVIKKEKKGLRCSLVCDLHSLRHLNRLPGNDLLQTVFQQHGVHCVGFLFSLQGYITLCNQVICIYRVGELSLCPTATTPTFFYERWFYSCVTTVPTVRVTLSNLVQFAIPFPQWVC